MYRVLTSLASLILFTAFVYGLLRLYRKQNAGRWPWQDEPIAPGTGRVPGTGTPPTPK